jgi:F-type H+-transporting ATPase subunit b
MTFDPWTFVFQIINFGILLLILKRVLYRPVREIMEKRRAQAIRTQQEAENARREAEDLLAKNQAEMQSLQAQRARMMEEMKEQITQQRQKMLAEADQEVQRHIDKERVLFATEKTRQTTEIKEQAMATVMLFAANILKGIADQDLHRALYRRLKAEVQTISAELNPGAETAGVLTVDVSSAYPLSEEERHSLQQELEKATGRQVALQTAIDQDLLAGAKVMIGERCFDASLNGQLTVFMNKVRKSA